MGTKLTVGHGGHVLTFFISFYQFSVNIPMNVGLRDGLYLVCIEVIKDLHWRKITRDVVIGNSYSSRLPHIFVSALGCRI